LTLADFRLDAPDGVAEKPVHITLERSSLAVPALVNASSVKVTTVDASTHEPLPPEALKKSYVVSVTVSNAVPPTSATPPSIAVTRRIASRRVIMSGA